jgi:DNA polymerase III subunit delta'
VLRVANLLDSLRDQPVPSRSLLAALAANRVHHAYLFAGADGVGKELAAFGLAQALLCEAPAADSGACGLCSACTRVREAHGSGTPKHPDLVVLERGLYDPKLIGRRTPETQDLSVDQIRTLVLARAAYAPHEGRARVYIMRRAEELSISAGNALLKTLEEPLPKTHFMLLSARPKELLATVRSRLLPLRFGRLRAATIAELAPQSKPELVAQARGSMAELARLEATLAEEPQRFAERLLAAVAAETLGPMLDAAEEFKKWKGDANELLDPVLYRLASSARAAVSTAPNTALAFAVQYREVRRAQRELDRNAAPALVIESLVARLRAIAAP